jgi:hypothetical protein
LTCICLRSRLFRMTLVTAQAPHITAQAPHISWRHTGATGRYWYVYHVSLDKVQSFSKRYPSYALRKHMCGSAGCGGIGKQWTKAIRCGACYYSIVVNAHRVTSMSDTDIDAVRKQKKAEYDKQYGLKRFQRHIHDWVLLSLKMEGKRSFFFFFFLNFFSSSTSFVKIFSVAVPIFTDLLKCRILLFIFPYRFR